MKATETPSPDRPRSLERMVRRRGEFDLASIDKKLSKKLSGVKWTHLASKFFASPEELGKFCIQRKFTDGTGPVTVFLKPSKRFTKFLSALWALDCAECIIGELAHTISRKTPNA